MEPSGLSLGFRPDLIKWEWYGGGERGKMGSQTWTLASNRGKALSKLVAERKWGPWLFHFPSQAPREESLPGRLRILDKMSKGNISWVETNCPPWGGGSVASEERVLLISAAGRSCQQTLLVCPLPKREHSVFAHP